MCAFAAAFLLSFTLCLCAFKLQELGTAVRATVLSSHDDVLLLITQWRGERNIYSINGAPECPGQPVP